MSPDNVVAIGDGSYRTVIRVTKPLPGFDGSDIAVASEDGSALYRFDASGRHLATVDPLTGVTRVRLAYDATGYLTSMTDATGNVTSVGRAADGTVQEIVSPYGQRTTLTLDANGYLAAARAPGGETVRFATHAQAAPQPMTDFVASAEDSGSRRVEGEANAMAATADATAMAAMRAARRTLVRRAMREWAADNIMRYDIWSRIPDKDGCQGHHPARTKDIIDALGREVYRKFEAIIAPVFGDNTTGTPHYDAGIAQKTATALGYGVVGSAMFGLDAARCSEESIFIIINAFLEHADKMDWKLNDDPR